MTKSYLWREFESGDGLFFKLLRFFILAGGIFVLGFTGILELTWPQQAVLGLLTVLLGIWVDRSSSSYLVTLTLMLASAYSTFRYGFWRISTTIKFFMDPGNSWTALDAFFICTLLFAEGYAFVILFLGFVQTLWPLRRTPVPLPEEPDQWPAVDLLIPTYNEPLSVVRYTALAAMNIDWPADKLNVYILDDGKREEFRRFAEEAGVGYMTRDDNKHAKAGNINRALQRLDSPYVAIFDCDHVPTRSFLQVTMGWFLRDSKLSMLQTPHHFYSPDPFERNLSQFRIIPNEGELFYGIVQDGNDFWNATFFCGSCAVLRRTALDEIGGIAVETVTEDAHTSLRMQMNGWNTAYINIPQAAGLATERLSGHVKQRIRWARGMIQIMRTDNPLFAKGLKFAQRLCYFNAMSHFLYALPRLIFLTAPLIYLVLGHTNVPGYWAAVLAYALPHLVLSAMTNSRIQGQHRHSFWNEVYETVLAPYILLPTLLAVINPKLGSFDVTAKGGVVNKSFFDNRIAQPFLLMLGMNALGILCGVFRFWQMPGGDLPFPFNIPANMYDGTHRGTIVMNLVWICFNVVILGVATAVAWESRQRRQTVRVTMAVQTDVTLANGSNVQGVTTDLSSGGVMIRLDHDCVAAAGESVRVTFPVLDGNATLPATIVGVRNNILRAQFEALNMQEEEALTMVLYSRADTWLGWGEAREADRPMASFARIFVLSMHGLALTFGSLFKSSKKPVAKGKLATSILPLLLLASLIGVSSLSAQLRPLHGAQVYPQVLPASGQVGAVQPAAAVDPTSMVQPRPDGGVQARPVAPGNFDNIFTLSDLGVADTIVLRGVDAYHTVYFSLPQTQVIKTATMTLRYHFSPGLLPALSHLKVSLNGTLFATLAVKNAPVPESPNAQPGTGQNGANTLVVSPSENNSLMTATLTLPAEMLVHNNELTFEFVGHYTMQCEDPSHTTLWSHVDPTSTIELAGSLLPLQNDLKLLPLPFYDSAVNLHPVVPIVFLGQPSPKGLQAAGIVASWFGILTESHPVRFPVSIGSIPSGNVIVIGENSAELPASLKMSPGNGPTIAMRTNPSDPYSKVLVLTGDNPDDLVVAATALALQRDMFQSDQVRIPSLKMPAPREPDDAPRWLSTDKITPVGDIAQTGDLQTDGSGPVRVYMKLPPDLCYSCIQKNLGFHMSYRYNGVPLSDASTLQVYMNDAYVSDTPMPHSDKASAELETVVPIPVSNMRPFSNTLMAQFIFLLRKKGKCEDTAPYNLKGAILKDSYLDIRDIPHLAVLPNLELFANAGYPFTRKADLSDTAVVLPDGAGPDELETYLTLMGHFGAQTGYPVLNVGITNADGMKSDGKKDYIVLGTVEDQPALGTLNKSLPVVVDGSGLHIQDTQGFFASLQHAWWKVRSSDHIQSGQLETAGGLPDVMIEGIEWPAGTNRSVVVIALRDHSVVQNFLPVFLKTSQSSDISQSVSVLHGSRFVSYRIGNDVYRVGSLSTWIQLNMLFSEFPWLIVVLTLVFCFFMAALIRAMLRRHARARLQGDD